MPSRRRRETLPLTRLRQLDVRRAVEQGLLIIPEASKSLPPALKAAYPAVSWRRVKSLGNVLRHEYRDVDPTVLWRIVQEQLQPLAITVREMLAKLDG